MTGDWGLVEPQSSRAPGEGWVEAPDAPVWAFLPAVWPAEHRCWVPEPTRIVSTWIQDRDQEPRRLPDRPWTAEEHEEHEADTNADLERIGVPPRPANRLWYLRLPKWATDLDDLLGQLGSAAEASGAGPGEDDFAQAVTRHIRERFGDGATMPE